MPNGEENLARKRTTISRWSWIPGEKIKHGFSEAQRGLTAFKSLELSFLPRKYFDKLSEDEIVCWMILHYGLGTVLKIATAVAAVPHTLTKGQQQQAMEAAYDVGDMTAAGLIRDHCSTLVRSHGLMCPSTLILAPPVCKCYSCDSPLVSNHSCSVR